MRALTGIGAPLLFCWLAIVQAAAQSVRGTLVETGSDAPVHGAIITLLAQDGSAAARALTDHTGSFLLHARQSGDYRLVARRVGYENAWTSSLRLSSGNTVEVRLTASPVATEIEGLVVEGRSRCAVRPEVGRSTAMLWEEVRKALEASEFTRKAGLYEFTIRRHERDLDPETLAVRWEDAELHRVASYQPFAARPVNQLLARGFVQQDASATIFFAPDAELLLSDRFLDDYCFQLRPAHPENADVVGLSFRPVSRRGPPAIHGTLWIDRESLELHTLEYGYTRTRLAGGSEQEVGGRLEFEVLPTGAWIIRRWWIRMPTQVTRLTQMHPSRRQIRDAVAALREEGGEVLETVTTEGPERVSTAEHGILTGVVTDSGRGTPVAEATVYLSGTGYAAETDGSGRFRIEGLREGKYSVSFTEPHLSAIGFFPVSEEVSIVAGDSVFLHLAVPADAREAAAERRCPVDRRPARSGGVAVGRVRRQDSGDPVTEAGVTFSWTRYTTNRGESVWSHPTSLTVTTDKAGAYVACGIATDRTLSVRVEWRGDKLHEGQLDELGRELTEQDFLVRTPSRKNVGASP